MATYTESLPCIVANMGNTKPATKKYLGSTTYVYDTEIDIEITCVDDTEAAALESFWRVDCNNGTTSFLAPLPIFGKTVNVSDTGTYTDVVWIGDFKLTKTDNSWLGNFKLRVV